ncbi:beta-N-acetylhexosaminidase [Oceanobacillus neutriphilus]|uniref:Beta-glucosidase n=1 Tax=Oceanobacillus neutriphilus TaxID=531815 RepID=A0ABQ2P2N4_9BACI|nr:beta-N-acetylhexosaminidase [Oceanobacillus neutriphilus]GGP16799.1 beta-glucosidase [Oceanobacillus neutriphilus]
MVKKELERKIGQLLVVGFDGTTVNPKIKKLIHDYHVGSIILFSRNIGEPEEVLQLTSDLQKEAKKAGYEKPLLICLDQENGVVSRIHKGLTSFPGSMALGATDNPQYAYKIGLATGKELKALGINWNLAPVLDVNNNPDNPVIGVRSFGEDAEKVAELGEAMMKGLQDAGVMTSLKHFPGHGDTNVDSHLDLPVISHEMERLENIELVPFKACIEAGADSVMTAHVYFPAIEPKENTPATLSKSVYSDLLREKLGFTGAITTDCMEMKAISNSIGTEKGAVKALQAGTDFVMISHTYTVQEGAIQEIVSAVESGKLSLSRIEESIQRIHRLKEKYTSWRDFHFPKAKDALQIVGSKKHRQLAQTAYRESVTIVHNHQLLPLNTEEQLKVLVLEPAHGAMMQAEDNKRNQNSLGSAVREYAPGAAVEVYDLNELEKAVDGFTGQAKNYDYIILGTLTITENSPVITLVNQLLKENKKVIGVGMRNPYDSHFLQNVQAFLNTYESSYPALQIAAGVIFGEEEAKGTLPVNI